jgi:Fungal Zn(2)-Cys(6) binuclear cluster domain
MLKQVINSRVLVNATLTLSTPEVPFFPLSGNPNLELCVIISSDPNGLQIQLSNLYLVGMTHELVQVFQATAAYNSTIRKYISGETVRMDNQTMCDWRNLLQHRIASLPSAQALMDTSGIYEVCRISVLIYSIGVTFPLPGVGAPFIPLIRELKVQLQILDIHRVLFMVPESTTIIQWVLTMGCIAATDLIERSWFVGALSQYIAFAQISEWNQFKQELQKVLWLDSACDMAGKLLWKEMQTLKEFEELSPQSQSSKIPVDFIKNDTPCGNCRVRKIKCDKRLPCQNCTKGGYLCTLSITTDDLKPPRVHLYSSRKKPCELCRQRKVKCDKQRPCQNCVKGSFTCSYI